MKRLLEAALVAAIATAVAAPAALANTYNASPNNAASLQFALDSAAAHAGDDTVQIPAGIYTGQFSYTADNPVQIVGAGPSATTLTSTAAGTTTLTVDAPGSSVRRLAASATRDPVVGDLKAKALSLPAGGTINSVDLRAVGLASMGLVAQGDVAASFVHVSATGDEGVAVWQLDGNLTLSDATIAVSGAQRYAIEVEGPHADIARVSVNGASTAIKATFGAAATVRDSLLVLPDEVGARGLTAGDNNSSSAFTTTIAADRVTLVGAPGKLQRGADVDADSGGDDFEVVLRNSVLVGFDTPLRCSGPGTGVVWADYSSLPQSPDSSKCSSGGAIRTHEVAGTPRFVDAGAGDYRLPWDSPLVDAGGPSLLGPDTDLAGYPRPVGPMDLGAYEYARRPPDPTATAAPGSAAVGEPFSFSSTASDPDPGDSPLSYSWQFDDGSTETGATVAHAFSSPGEHSATVTVTDPGGASSTARATVSVTPGAAGGTTTQADTTAPAVSRFAVSPRRVVLGGRRARIGFGLSEAARVTISFERRAGRRWAKVRGALRLTAAAGRSSVRFAGRLSRRRALAPGAYRATLVARDDAGNAGRPAHARFTLRRR